LQGRKLLDEVAESHRFGLCHDTASVFVGQNNLGRPRLLRRDRSGKRVAIARPYPNSFSCCSRSDARIKAQKTVNPAPSMTARNEEHSRAGWHAILMADLRLRFADIYKIGCPRWDGTSEQNFRWRMRALSIRPPPFQPVRIPHQRGRAAACGSSPCVSDIERRHKSASSEIGEQCVGVKGHDDLRQVPAGTPLPLHPIPVWPEENESVE
jgi:hypothetical protein